MDTRCCLPTASVSLFCRLWYFPGFYYSVNSSPQSFPPLKPTRPAFGRKGFAVRPVDRTGGLPGRGGWAPRSRGRGRGPRSGSGGHWRSGLCLLGRVTCVTYKDAAVCCWEQDLTGLSWFLGCRGSVSVGPGPTPRCPQFCLCPVDSGAGTPPCPAGVHCPGRGVAGQRRWSGHAGRPLSGRFPSALWLASSSDHT